MFFKWKFNAEKRGPELCTPKYEGGCKAEDVSSLMMLDLSDRAYSFKECYDQCLQRSQECDGFLLGNPGTSKVGHCQLFKAGCEKDGNPNWNYYSMNDCTIGTMI